MSMFQVGETEFLVDRRPLRVLSGGIDYFRVHPTAWAERITRAQQLGLNTITTRVPWNAHEVRPGEWNWGGGLNLARFLDLVADHDMYAIVCPGPFIGAGWSGGGLPAWLMLNPRVRVRRSETLFMAAAAEYLRQVHQWIAPRQIDQNGPVIMVQIDHMYGAFSDDAHYLPQLIAITRNAGIDVPLVTVDRPLTPELIDGSALDALSAIRIDAIRQDPDIDASVAALRAHQPSGPLFVMDFATGRPDYWRRTRSAESSEMLANHLNQLLAMGASVNLAPFHGGTNYGLSNGAHRDEHHRPIVTSFDCDAPLDEAGRPTEKYWALHEVVAKHAPVLRNLRPKTRPAPQVVGSFDPPIADLEQVAARMGVTVTFGLPPTADAVGQTDGLTWYKTALEDSEDAEGPGGPIRIDFGDIRDRGLVYANGRKVCVLERRPESCVAQLPPGTRQVSVLVEDLGRLSEGSRLGEPKGIIGPVTTGGRLQRDWEVLPIRLSPFDTLESMVADVSEEGASRPGWPHFRTGSFQIIEPDDLFLDTTSWGKGMVWVNGFALGRFWREGPQQTLYVPSGILMPGTNQVLVLELEPTRNPVLATVSRPNLGEAL